MLRVWDVRCEDAYEVAAAMDGGVAGGCRVESNQFMYD
jgi:hypothetical protein